MNPREVFCRTLAQVSGLDVNVILAWCIEEQGWNSTDNAQDLGNFNWLNIGYFDSGPSPITRDPGFATPWLAAETTYKFLTGQVFDASPGIRAILGAAGKTPLAQTEAIGASGWATGAGYGQNIFNVYTQLIGQGLAISLPTITPPEDAMITAVLDPQGRINLFYKDEKGDVYFTVRNAEGTSWGGGQPGVAPAGFSLFAKAPA